MSFRASDIEIVASELMPNDRIILTTREGVQSILDVERMFLDLYGPLLQRGYEKKQRAPARTDLVTLLTRRGEQLQQVSQREREKWEEVLFE